MSSSKKGKFIVVEGGDGSGKGTLMERLKMIYPDAVFTREPGGSKFGEIMRGHLRDDQVLSPTLSPTTQLLGMMAARADHFEKIIKPALDQGKNVFTDRFDASTWAYQVVHNRSLLLTLFYECREVILGKINTVCPVYIYLDVAPDIGISRRNSDSSEEPNHFDNRPLSYHEIVRAGYLEFIKSPRGYVVDAKRPLEEVMGDAVALVAKLLG